MTARIGIIGAGSVAQLHAGGFAAAGVRPAAICDVDLERARSLAAGFNGASATDEVEELLASDVEGVVVAVPNFLHKPLAIKALQAGKDVLLEKPMALSVAECDEIVSTWKGTDRILQMGFVCRNTATAMAARRAVAMGRLGRVHHVRVSVWRRRGIPGLGRWFTTRDRSGGGVLIDLGVHLIDLAMHLTGWSRPTRVSGSCASLFGSPIDDYSYTEMWGGPPDPSGIFDVEDSAVGLVRYDDGGTLELNAAWAANLPEGAMRDGVVILGDRGGLYFDIFGDRLQVATEHDGLLEDVVTHVAADGAWDAAWRRQSERFLDSVRTRTPPEATAEDGRAVQAVLEAFYRSSEEGREVEVPV